MTHPPPVPFVPGQTMQHPPHVSDQSTPHHSQLPYVPGRHSYASRLGQVATVPGSAHNTMSNIQHENRAFGYPLSQKITVHGSPHPTLNNAVHTFLPGGQEIHAHRGVRQNHPAGQHAPSEIVLKQDVRHGEPYTASLYETPYNSAQNLVSTGVLSNGYTGETFETFENKLPPPTTTRGHMPAYHLKQANPKLIWANGGYNHHNPPPRKTEHLGNVFNPVSVKGGATAFGEQTYSGEIRKQQAIIGARDLYNNRNGDQVVEPSLNGERPSNMFGLVPRFRYNPKLAPTNELDMRGYLSQPVAEGTADSRKREQHTGQWFNRKQPVLASRASYPTTFMNGVQAVSVLPITTDNSGPMRADFQQSYIPTPGFDGAGTGLQLSQQTLRRTRPDALGSLPTAGVRGSDSSTIRDTVTARTSKKGGARTNPTAAVGGALAGLLVTDTAGHASKKVGPWTNHTAAVGGALAGLLVTDTTGRNTKKAGAWTNPTAAVTGVETGVFVSDKTVRDTLKTATMSNPFRVAGPHQLDLDAGNVWGDVTSIQHRGKDELHYTPSISSIPAGSNGTSTRFAHVLNRPGGDDVSFNYAQVNPTNLASNPNLLFSGVRQTGRAARDVQQLAAALDDY